MSTDLKILLAGNIVHFAVDKECKLFYVISYYMGNNDIRDLKHFM